jgi:cyclic nucleotide gated channel alpha 3
LKIKRYWSITALTLTQNHETKPASREDYIFLSIELIFALLLFATIMGHVASIVSNLSNARKDFQGKTKTKILEFLSMFWFF